MYDYVLLIRTRIRGRTRLLTLTLIIIRILLSLRILELFAGTEPSMRDAQGNPLGGYSAIAAMINKTVPTHAQNHTAEILAQLGRERFFPPRQTLKAFDISFRDSENIGRVFY